MLKTFENINIQVGKLKKKKEKIITITRKIRNNRRNNNINIFKKKN